MNASELAAKLLSMVENHGDFPVEVDGYDVHDLWLMEGADKTYYYFSYAT